MTRYSIAEARGRFSKILREAEAGSSVQITRRGKPVAYVVSVDRFDEDREPTEGFWDRFRNFRREYGVEELDIDPDEVYRDARPDDPGRDFSW